MMKAARSVEKNLTTGVHLFTWPSGHIDGGRLDIILDQATFVPFDRLSFRRTGDVSNDIWYPWAIDNVKAFDVARLLDMIDTNNDNPETWGPVATRLNWRCSPEAVIELSNRALVNPWVLFTYQTSPEDCAYYVSMLQNGITSTVKEFPSEPVERGLGRHSRAGAPRWSPGRAFWDALTRCHGAKWVMVPRPIRRRCSSLTNSLIPSWQLPAIAKASSTTTGM